MISLLSMPRRYLEVIAEVGVLDMRVIWQLRQGSRWLTSSPRI